MALSRIHRVLRVVVCGVIAAPLLTARADSQGRSTPPGRAFEAVSIRRNPSSSPGSRVSERPDGGLSMINVPTALLLSRAYPPAIPIEMVDLPGWALSERYDVNAVSSLPMATPDDRVAMLRQMLAERFQLAVHWENREHPAYDLVLIKKGELGPGLMAADVDCTVAVQNAQPAPPAPPGPPDFSGPPPRCTLRTVDRVVRDRMGDNQGQRGDLLEGETTLANLASALRSLTGRLVVDKTGLTGTYRVRMDFDRAAALRGPGQLPSDDAGASIFTAVQEQLRLKLQSSQAVRETLVIDRLERPSAN